jgi:hypothetical protein
MTELPTLADFIFARRPGGEVESEANARLIAAAPDGYSLAVKFINEAVAEFNIPPDADEGWVVDTLGHGLGGVYLDALAFLAKARGEQ